MNILAAALLALCAVLPQLARSASPPPSAPPTPPTPSAPATPAELAAQAETAAARQVLVMLRLPPQHFHPDASYAGRYPDDSGRAARRRIAENLARAQGLKLVGDWPMPAIGVDCYVMEHDGSLDTQALVDTLSRDRQVLWVQPVSLFHGQGGAEPLYDAQPAARSWHLADLHKASTGRDVRLAVIDSGIDQRHPDLAGQVLLRENFVDNMPDGAETHGTAVAGIIAAHAGNGVGIAGVAPEARLMALRACWQARLDTRCSSFSLGKAINFALMNQARIINLSLSGPPDRLLQTLLDLALQRGIAVVGAVDPAREGGGFPASHPGVIPVAPQAPAQAPASKALLAPGTDILTTTPGARWGFVSGSSYAAAHVAGLMALIAQLRPDANAAQLRREFITVAGARPQAGNIDVCATIARVKGACACSCTTTAAMQPNPGP